MNVEQDAAGRALLATVVQLALTDACLAPIKRREDGTLPMQRDAFTAMRFFFDTRVAGLNEYAMWLDINPDRVRRRLLDMMADTTPKAINGFDTMQRRNMRQNYDLWRMMRNAEAAVTEEDDND